MNYLITIETSVNFSHVNDLTINVTLYYLATSERRLRLQLQSTSPTSATTEALPEAHTDTENRKQNTDPDTDSQTHTL